MSHSSHQVVGVDADAGLLGAVGIAARAGAVDIDRLVVAPRAFRQGIGTLLVRHVQSIAGGEVTVSTGQANAPARGLYERCGFVVQGHAEVEPGLWVTDYRWSARPVDENIEATVSMWCATRRGRRWLG